MLVPVADSLSGHLSVRHASRTLYLHEATVARVTRGHDPTATVSIYLDCTSTVTVTTSSVGEAIASVSMSEHVTVISVVAVGTTGSRPVLSKARKRPRVWLGVRTDYPEAPTLRGVCSGASRHSLASRVSGATLRSVDGLWRTMGGRAIRERLIRQSAVNR